MLKEFEMDDVLNAKFISKTEDSSILKTLHTRLNYEEAKIITQYSNWKKF